MRKREESAEGMKEPAELENRVDNGGTGRMQTRIPSLDVPTDRVEGGLMNNERTRLGWKFVYF